MKRKYGIDQVSVRLVKEAPILSEEEISTPEDAIRVLGDTFKDYDREVVGVVHLYGDTKPVTGASEGSIKGGVLIECRFHSFVPQPSKWQPESIEGGHCTYRQDAATLYAGRNPCD